MKTARVVRVASFLFTSLALLAAVAVGCGSNGNGNGAGNGGKDSGGAATGEDGGGAGAVDGTVAASDAGVNADATTESDAGSGTSSPGADASITAFDNTLICFGAVADSGTTCSRHVDSQTTFPTDGTFSNITMHVTLKCPTTVGGCDHWDRVGSVYLVNEGATTDAGTTETLVELGRFVTPYDIISGVNSPPAWDIDVTELRPLLSGSIKLRAWIDTWDPQGDPADNGAGWIIGVSFSMTGGTPAKIPVAVVPIWAWTTMGQEPTGVPYGEPTQPISKSVPPQSLTLPAGATSFGIRSTITGHGQANLDNCAEFCSRNHTWTVGTTANTKAMWRTDCGNFKSSGTYNNPRAGWCPGDKVTPWDIDVTSQVVAGANTFTYGVDDYTNTCGGTADDGGLICTGCSPAACGYNGNGHTSPFYYISALLIGFR